jgi:hypothetical protein
VNSANNGFSGRNNNHRDNEINELVMV